VSELYWDTDAEPDVQAPTQERCGRAVHPPPAASVVVEPDLMHADRWSYEDVAANADDILERVRAGTMPCDGAWPQEQTDAFACWIEAGKPH
jgi:hypothetical protein